MTASLGVPGLTLVTRYTIRGMPLKSLSILMRSSTVRSSYASDYDEVRFITSYALGF